MEPRNLLKPDFETSVTFEPLGIFCAVFTVMLKRMSSIILYMCLYVHWGLFNARNIDYKGFNFDYGILLHMFEPLSHNL